MIAEDTLVAAAVFLTFGGFAIPALFALVAMLLRWWRDAHGTAAQAFTLTVHSRKPPMFVWREDEDGTAYLDVNDEEEVEPRVVGTVRSHPTNPDLGFVEVDAETWRLIHRDVR